MGTHFGLVNGDSVHQFLFKNMSLFVNSCWVFISSCLFFLFRVISRYFSRIWIQNSLDDSNCDRKEERIILQPGDLGCLNSLPEVPSFENSECKELGKKEDSGFSFKFQFESSEDIRRKVAESECCQNEENTPAMKISNYSFLSEKEIIGFVEEPGAATLTVKESFANSKGSSQIGENKIPRREFDDWMILLEKDFHKFDSGSEAVHEEVEQLKESDQISTEESFIDFEINSLDKNCNSNIESRKFFDGFSAVSHRVINSGGYEFFPGSGFSGFECEEDAKNGGETAVPVAIGGIKAELMKENQILESTQTQKIHNSVRKADDFSASFPSVEKQGDVFCATDTDSMNFSDEINLENSDENETESTQESEESKRSLTDQKFHISNRNSRYWFSSLDNDFSASFPSVKKQTDDFWFSDSDSMNFSDDINLENSDEDEIEWAHDSEKSKRSMNDQKFHLSSLENDFSDSDFEYDEADGEEEELVDELQKSRETHDWNSSNSGFDDSGELESAWEHEDLLEHLKMELKKVRGIGLPTIYEEEELLESVKTIEEDLKEWKMEEVMEDPMEELQKFYKSYKERMRKLDVVNFQKMHAIGFLRLKEPLQYMAWRKTSLLPPNLWLWRSRNSDADPSAKSMKELQVDLEMVYMGQACLSWEILHWQYGIARSLPESDPHHKWRYNQVAGEFQQFQVLLQRFLDNEPFTQGPRVQNYVQNRCVFRSLLQVPAIKEDCLKDKLGEKRGGNDVISSRMLAEIIEEAMGILWEFIKADKDESNATLKGFLRTKVEFQDPSDSELFKNIQADLQKKEKKLKDLLRTGNCIVKKFQKHQENRSSLLLFFSQVDMKLVSRVLKMSRITTDQLLWCHKKMSKITFKNRKIQRESSFLLFPC